MSKRKDLFLLAGLILLLLILNYSYLDQATENFLIGSEPVLVERVIDGDTIVAEGETIRLLGINTPERGEQYYLEAKRFLESIILNETVHLKFGKDKEDRYGRTLAYVFLDGKNINLELVEEGFANFYFPSGKDQYYNEFLYAWENCENNLCTLSSDECSSCIKLKEFDYSHQKIILHNECMRTCDITRWSIKDEGRKTFRFPEYSLSAYHDVSISTSQGDDFLWNESYIWTTTGDTLFLRDAENRLVLWETY